MELIFSELYHIAFPSEVKTTAAERTTVQHIDRKKTDNSTLTFVI